MTVDPCTTPAEECDQPDMSWSILSQTITSESIPHPIQENSVIDRIECTSIRRRATPPPPIKDGRRRTHYKARRRCRASRRESARRGDECLSQVDFQHYLSSYRFIKPNAVGGKLQSPVHITHVSSVFSSDIPSRTTTNIYFKLPCTWLTYGSPFITAICAYLGLCVCKARVYYIAAHSWV